jgi:hypothetical protein
MDEQQREWIEARIASKKARLVLLETAVDTVISTGTSYSLDTGQSRLMVTRANLSEFKNQISSLENDIATLYARLGCARGHGVPGW